MATRSSSAQGASSPSIKLCCHRFKLPATKSTITSSNRVHKHQIRVCNHRIANHHVHRREAPPTPPPPPPPLPRRSSSPTPAPSSAGSMASVRAPWRLAQTGVEQPTTTLAAGVHSFACSRPWACPPSRLSPPSARDQIDGAAAELLILTVAGAEGRQAPCKRAWVGPWRHPSRHNRGGLLEAEVRHGGARAEAAKREKHRRAQAFGREEMHARSSFWRRGGGGARYPHWRGIQAAGAR
jgi:hypothetical protein